MNLALFVLSWVTLVAHVAPSPVPPIGLVKKDHGGLTLRMTKRGPNPLHRRANGLISNNRWWVTLGIGTPPQDLNFLPDSGANDFSMASTLIPPSQRGDSMLYDPSKSSTAKVVPGYSYSQCFVSGYCGSGVVYNETITVGGQAFSQVPILVQNYTNQVTNGDRTGNLGLNPGYNGGMPTSPNGLPTFMQNIKSRLPKGVATFSYNSFLQEGELDLGFIDSNKYTGAMTYLNNIGTGLWKVHIDGMVINGKLVSTPFDAELDHGTGDARIPKPALDAYFSQIAGATWNSGAGTYDFPCNANLTDMTFSVGLLPLGIPKYSWAGTPVDGTSNTCRCGMTIPDDGSNAGFLGEAWLEGAFVVFDYDNFRVGLANRPAYSTKVPTGSIAGSTKFCTGTNFTGTCTQAVWQSNTCGPLSGTPYYHNIGSFSPSVGACTLYSDNVCASPLPYASGIHSPGISNTYGSGPLVGSYSCFYPSDYPPRGKGVFRFCDAIGFGGNCQNLNWQSWSCQNLPTALNKNVLSAGTDTGYCYLFTNQDCTGAVEDGAPFVNPGYGNLQVGKQVQSFMCV